MRETTRRGFLAATAGSVALSAGCLSDSSTVSTETQIGTIASTERPMETPLPTPIAGDAEADVTVAVHEDIACPHCATYSLEVFPQLAREYLETGEVRYEYYDYPIPVDEEVSWGAANAARAIQTNLGAQGFFVYLERLFNNQSLLSSNVYEELTEGLEVEPEIASDAAEGGVYNSIIEQSKETGTEKGVDSTPSVFVNGEGIDFGRSISYPPVKEAIEDAL